ncbi:tetratricopeptide (TPR) repeat protein [Streptomyces sp. SAI-170]|uniref:CHAT domain-containing protein n=1 Tax=Streptomyces sp. SAI-170 TaxID=3377729 RepID=UPI003C7BD8DF
MLDTVQGRLLRCSEGELSAAIETGALHEARKLVAYLEGDDDLAVHQALGTLHWYRMCALPGKAAEADADLAVALFTACFLSGVRFSVPAPLLPFVVDSAARTATDWLRDRPAGFDPVSAAFTGVWQRIAYSTAEGHSQRALRLTQLSSLLLRRFDRTEAREDLDEAVRAAAEAVRCMADDEPERATVLHVLHHASQVRFRRTGDEADLDEAVRAGLAAVLATPAGDDTEAVTLTSVLDAVWTRFEGAGEVSDLEEAVCIARRLVEVTAVGSVRRAALLSGLSTALAGRSGHSGDPDDLDEAVRLGQAAVRCCPADHADRASALSNLVAVLIRRFKRFGVRGDLEDAVGAGREAVRIVTVGHPARPTALTNLAMALQLLYENVEDASALDEAVCHLRQVVEATSQDGDPELAQDQSNLASVLLTRHQHTGSAEDLEEAAHLIRQAVRATAAGHPERAVRLTCLGGVLRARFARTGEQHDLDEAVDILRDAVGDAPADGTDALQTLSSLSIALLTRFEHTRGRADLDEAVRIGDETIAATPVGHPDLAQTLGIQGVAFLYRYERTGNADDLEESIRLQRRAVGLVPPGHYRRAATLSNLGDALRMRFERPGRPGNPVDLDEAIHYGREAVCATASTDHPDIAARLNNLGLALRLRHELTGAPGDLDEAVRFGREAVRATVPADHPDAATRWNNLGLALGALHVRTEDPVVLAQAVAAHVAAWETPAAPPFVRIRAAQAAANLLATAEDRESAADLLEAAVRLLPEVAPRRLERGDQQYTLSLFPGLAGDAAALALDRSGGTAAERAARALQLLESGRAVLLSQALNTRNDLTDLRRLRPGLAERFTRLRDLLDQPAPGGPGPAEERHRLAQEFAATLAQIRADEEFRRFGLPPAVDELLDQAQDGPVVVFNVSRHRSDALLLTRTGITALPLPGLGHDTLVRRVDAFHRALRTVVTGQDLARRDAAEAVLVGTLEWLWDVAAEPVLRALGYLRQPAEDAAWPRVWWSPGGLLGLLPLHAAGRHTGPRQGSVLDRVVSSYTPTVRALSHARRHAPAPGSSRRALVVAMPVTRGLPGGHRLPDVPAEVARVRRHLPDNVLLSAPDPDDGPGEPTALPTRANVLAALSSCAIAHFSCHGRSHPADPSQSMLLLHDHDTDPLTVASLAPVRLEQAELAFLSACRTAAIDAAELVDEAIHLTSAFQLAGFARVIGTLWSISDRIAVTVADAFYTHLRTGQGVLDTGRAACALHHAVRAVRDGDDLGEGRDRRRTPFVWAAYLHSGA